MDASRPAYPESSRNVYPRGMTDLFERVNRRREDVAHRWERVGTEVDVVELIREIREES